MSVKRWYSAKSRGVNRIPGGAEGGRWRRRERTTQPKGQKGGHPEVDAVALVQGAGREEEVGLVGKSRLETMEGLEGS